MSLTICLNMIVKDEAPVIERCLASVLPIIDNYCIVDTGSSDDTIERIERFFHGKRKGVVHQRPWRDFGHNRDEALQLCREMQPTCDYAMFIDADEVLEHRDGRALTPEDGISLRNNLQQLNCDLGLYKVDFDGTLYQRFFVCRLDMPFHWYDPVHEYLKCDVDCTQVLFTWIYNRPRSDGARSRSGNKYEGDILALQKALEERGDDARLLFYLGQTLQCAGRYSEAIAAYRKRLEMDENSQERYVTHVRLGQLLAEYESKEKGFIEFAKAYELDHERAEALHQLTASLRGMGLPRTGLVFAREAMQKRSDPRKAKLFVNMPSFGWHSMLEAARCVVLGCADDKLALEDAVTWLRELSESNDAPDSVREASRDTLATALAQPHFESSALIGQRQASLIVVRDFLQDVGKVQRLALSRRDFRPIANNHYRSDAIDMKDYFQRAFSRIWGAPLQIVRDTGYFELLQTAVEKPPALRAVLVLNDAGTIQVGEQSIRAPSNTLIISNDSLSFAQPDEYTLIWLFELA